MPNIDARAERSREALIQSGMELINTNKDAKLTEIAQAAGVGRATLYRQFASRDELVLAIANTCMGTFENATRHIDEQAKSGLDAIRLLFEAIMPLSKELQFLMRVEMLLEDHSEISTIYKQQQKELRELLKFCQKEGSIDKNLPTPWLLSLLDGLFFTAWLYMTEHGASEQEASKQAFSCFQKSTST